MYVCMYMCMVASSSLEEAILAPGEKERVEDCCWAASALLGHPVPCLVQHQGALEQTAVQIERFRGIG
jgi:hypothetical protein